MSDDRPEPRAIPGDRELLRRMVASRRALRQGFLLREVLGPPVALRESVDERPLQ